MNRTFKIALIASLCLYGVGASIAQGPKHDDKRDAKINGGFITKGQRNHMSSKPHGKSKHPTVSKTRKRRSTMSGKSGKNHPRQHSVHNGSGGHTSSHVKTGHPKGSSHMAPKAHRPIPKDAGGKEGAK